MAKSPNDYPKVQFQVLDSTMLEALESRAAHGLNASSIARRDLERYYSLLRRSLPRFSEPEAMLLADVLNGVIPTPEAAHLLWAEVADAIQMDGVDRKWEVDGPALVARLRGLTPFEQLAVADAIERAWSTPGYAVADMRERLRIVGLVREER